MEHPLNFNGLIKKFAIRIFFRFLLSILILYILPLITISGETTLSEKVVFFFFSVFSWLYMSVLFLVIAGFQIRKMLLMIKKEMDIVYTNSIQMDSSNHIEPFTLLEFSETDRQIRSMKEKIKEMLEKEIAQKKDLIFKISTASHDLKTPLTVIQGNADFLLYSSLSKTERQCLQDMAKAAERMKYYVNSLIDYSKTYYNDGTERSPYPLLEISEAIRQEVFFHIKEKGKVHFQSSLPEEKCGNFHLNYLLRAVSNLLENAKEYAKNPLFPTEILLTEEDGKLLLSIWNHGSAFPEELLDHGVKLFYKENRARTSDTTHYGIGLAFVKRVCELHQGSLTLSNERDGALALLTLNLS